MHLDRGDLLWVASTGVQFISWLPFEAVVCDWDCKPEVGEKLSWELFIC